ncbi:Pkinase-domain-containing protein [Coprinellus micaceus]|uniref:Pkinase-domain-containing protein n=1 Tax=Coprinellus micaceus TaxID=71717 RepID=A0A4Y7TMW1_COPMI|nr:Pkinase-domain-containing protein [Coprinellus micaceus]
MPTTGVVDAFKNLIRHGRHHNHARVESPPRTSREREPREDHQAQAHSTAHNSTAQHHAVERRNIAPADKENHTAAAASKQPSREAAEMIVNEERQAKNKMPTYKGLENFELLEKMGDGAFSNVYKAHDLTSSKKVAVKVVRKYELNASQAGDKHLNPQFKKKPRVTERANILKEVQIMRGTNHPSIVKLHSFSESPEHYFLVLELMGGGELFHQIVKLTYFSENLSRHVILQVAQGIRYLHEERGVVHRDIKPENLLFERIDIIPSKNPIHRPYDENKEDEGEFIPGVGGGGIGRVKIADFGLSKVVWDEQTMTPCGTVGYTAPEIVKDERYSKSVDMWALGCVLYTLLCGFPPFYDESINVLTEKVARGYYTFLSPWWDDISAQAKDLITHLLCVDPAQRYTIDEFLAHPWCTAAPAPPPPPTPRIPGRPVDSPLLSAPGNWEGRSPGLATLKEAFDITYAVHRMEEEGARRRNRARGPGGARAVLSGLNEDDEDEGDEDEDVHRQQRNGQAQVTADPAAAYGQTGRRVAASHAIGEGRAGIRDQGSARVPGGTSSPGRSQRRHRQFELDIDGATLLERRNRRALGVNGPGAVGIARSSPLRMEGLRLDEARAPIQDPGSPMRVG